MQVAAREETCGRMMGRKILKTIPIWVLEEK
jgi:hypothetical protein